MPSMPEVFVKNQKKRKEKKKKRKRNSLEINVCLAGNTEYASQIHIVCRRENMPNKKDKLARFAFSSEGRAD
jgi:hypothetical protein